MSHEDSYGTGKTNLEDLLAPHLYQNEKLLWKTFFLVSIAGALTSFNIYVYQFLGGTPDHWCLVEDLQNVSWTENQIKEISLPLLNTSSEATYSKCDMFDIDYKVLAELPYTEAVTIANQMKKNASTVQCEHHVYAGDSQTFVTKWDLVCQRRPLYATTQSAIQGGFVIDCFLFGFLTDRFGRRKTFVWCLWGCIISGLLYPVAPSVYIFIVLRMLSSTFGLATINAGLVLCLELSSVKRRSMIGACFSLPWALGIMIIPAIAYFITDWVYLQIAITAPFIILAILVGLLTSESPKWLILNSRRKDACLILEKLNDWTTEKTEAMIGEMEQLSSQSSSSIPANERSELQNSFQELFRLFTRKDLQVKSLVVLFTWFSGSMVYYGLGLGADALNANEYWFIFGSGLAEFIALLSLWPLSMYLGRKKGLMSFFAGTAVTISSVAVIIFQFGQYDLSWLKVTFYLLGKFCITCAFQLIWIYTNELYPTNLRGLASGAGSSMARVGSLFSPFVNDILGEKINWAPSAIFGGLSIATMFFIFFLPETGQVNMTEDEIIQDKKEESTEFAVKSTENLV